MIIKIRREKKERKKETICRSDGRSVGSGKTLPRCCLVRSWANSIESSRSLRGRGRCLTSQQPNNAADVRNEPLECHHDLFFLQCDAHTATRRRPWNQLHKAQGTQRYNNINIIKWDQDNKDQHWKTDRATHSRRTYAIHYAYNIVKKKEIRSRVQRPNPSRHLPPSVPPSMPKFVWCNTTIKTKKKKKKEEVGMADVLQLLLLFLLRLHKFTSRRGEEAGV